MDAPLQPSRRTLLAGLGGLATALIGSQYIKGAPAEAAWRPPVPGKSLLVPPTPAGAWFGAYPGPSNAAPADYEVMVGRKLDIVKRYEAIDSVWPNKADQALIADGRYLSVCWSSRVRATGTVATWADVASGRYDSAITAQAHRLASIDPIWVGYDNEMDGWVNIARSGPLTYYPAAYRHIQDIVRPIAPNVLWIWCPTGNNLNPAVAACYPGDDFVDWICYDPYDATLSKGSPFEAYRRFPEWLDSTGIGAGKPLGIAETGFHQDLDGTDAAAEWLHGVPYALTHLGIRMWTWFNSYGNLGDTSIAPGTTAAKELKSIGKYHMLSEQHW